MDLLENPEKGFIQKNIETVSWYFSIIKYFTNRLGSYKKLISLSIRLNNVLIIKVMD